MKILVTGGAGYIGSVAVHSLISKGHTVSVIDNLSKGKRELVPANVTFFKKDLTDDLTEVFECSSYDAVMHFAAYKSVEESMANGVKYSDNLSGTINLLNHMVKHGVNKIIFSSTAAVYGDSSEPLTEDSQTNPVNFYGFTKLECEKIIEWYNKIHNLEYVSLRYFNVAGDVLKYVDPDAKNIFPILMEVIEGQRDAFAIFGTDYNTPDGTCVRDYIHIQDLVDAHIMALDTKYNGVLNLGSGKGFSVNELVSAFKDISGIDFPTEFVEKRAGDPASVLASNKKAEEILGWKPKLGIDEMIKSTLEVGK